MYIGYIYESSWVENDVEKYYIGQHSTLQIRETQQQDKYYKGSGIAIADAITKFGKDHITCTPIVWCKTPEELNLEEIRLISEYKAKYGENCVNIAKGGNSRNWSFYMDPQLLRTYWLLKNNDPEHIKKLKAGIKRYNDSLTPEEKANRKAWNSGLKMSKKFKDKLKLIHSTEEYKYKQRMSHLGKKMPAEFIEKNRKNKQGTILYNNGEKEIFLHDGDAIPEGFSKGGLKKPNNHTNHGRHWYHDADNINEAMLKPEDVPEGWILGRLPMSEEQKQKLHDYASSNEFHRKGVKMSDEAKQKLSASLRGRKLSQDQCLKMKEIFTGSRLYTNGIDKKMYKQGEEIPEGWLTVSEYRKVNNQN